MLFADLSPAPADPILGLARQFAADPGPNKVDLGIGVYKDATGRAPVLASVKRAELWLAENQPSKDYLSSAGNPDYNQRMRQLVLGDDAGLLARAVTIQTPGGTGALRVAADFLQKLNPGGGRLFVPDPTWANHIPLFAKAGHEVVAYPYYDSATATLRFDAMMAALEGIGPGDVVLFHGCCHNPIGADPSIEQWGMIADLLAKTGATPLVDLAYLGFGDGIDADAAGVRLLAERLPELIVASSCSKNFALYRDRVGALTLVAETGDAAERALGHLLPVVRTNYSMPPDHGAAVVAHILGDATLRAGWEVELTAMRDRINAMRHALAVRLADRSGGTFDFLTRQRGMFTMLGVTPEAVARLRTEHHVHISGSGRVNVAGLTDANVDHVAAAIAAVIAR